MQYKVEGKGVLIRLSNPIHAVKTLNFSSKGHTANIAALGIYFNISFSELSNLILS